jgi:hypothetical protein
MRPAFAEAWDAQPPKRPGKPHPAISEKCSLRDFQGDKPSPWGSKSQKIEISWESVHLSGDLKRVPRGLRESKTPVCALLARVVPVRNLKNCGPRPDAAHLAPAHRTLTFLDSSNPTAPADIEA